MLTEYGADCTSQNKHYQTPLHICAQSSNGTSCAVHLLPRIHDIDASDEERRTPLHYACFFNNIEMCSLLLSNGSNPNLQDKTGNSPLHYACEKGFVEIIELLLNGKHKVNLNCTDNNLITPLHLCAFNGHSDCLKKLIDSGANIDVRTTSGALPIHYAAYFGNIDLLNILLNRSQKRTQLDDTDLIGNTLLHFAACTMSFNSTIINHILTLEKTLLNVKNNRGQTPLHLAVSHNNIDAVSQLINAGVDASIVDNDHLSPLHLCTSLMTVSNRSCILSKLVSYYPNGLCQQNSDGLIPLHSALLAKDYLTIDILLPSEEFELIEQAKQSLRINDNYGRCSIHFASGIGYTKLIKEHFTENDVNIINQQDIYGLSPLHHSCVDWHGLNSIDVLLKLGANVNLKCFDFEGIPLHYAFVYCCSSDVIEKLLKAGSDPSIRTKHGWDCLSYAVIQNDINLLRLLSTYYSYNINREQEFNVLHLASVYGKDIIFEYLIDNYFSGQVDMCTSDGYTALQLCSLYGDISCINILINRKANVSKINTIDGKTCLHYSAQNGHTECLHTLLHELQLNNTLSTVIDLVDTIGKTALHYAVESASPTCVRHLLKFDCNLNIGDKNGLTPLHYCALLNSEECLQELLENEHILLTITSIVDKQKKLPLHYADGNVTILSTLLEFDYKDVGDEYAFSPLHYAAFRGHETAVRIIIESGQFGLLCWKTSRITPLHLACLKGHLSCVKTILKSFHKDSIQFIINLQTKHEKLTPLHLAVFNKDYLCTKQLLKYSAKINCFDHLNRTPLDYAKENGLNSIVELLSSVKDPKNI
ncbi:unnamed protein product [Didymodactylos carnosus]|nr:unnamed protein product [Didymodactylos carnosus]CAF3635319.1 unnamed protein product [Didymodactylos carnosus]